jgi:hypothetical protein
MPAVRPASQLQRWLVLRGRRCSASHGHRPIARTFACPWTGKTLRGPTDYDLDHLMPVSVYPINEMWYLVPTDRLFNQHVKPDRLPSGDMMGIARPRLEVIYGHYATSTSLGEALRQDVAARFTRLA